MSTIDDINAKIPDNTAGLITPAKMREAFALGLGAVVVKKVSVGDIQVEVASGFTTILTDTFTNILGTTALQDGNEHVVRFVMKSGSPDIGAADSAWGWMRPKVADATGSPVRLALGGAGGTPNSTLKLWVDDGAFITIKKTDPGDDTSTWDVIHVDLQGGHAAVVSSIPPPPTADGDYKLNIAAGVATWAAA